MYKYEGSCKVNLRNFWDVSNFALKAVAIILLVIGACAVVSLLIQCCCCCIKNADIDHKKCKDLNDNLKFVDPNQKINDVKFEKKALSL